MPYDDKVSSDLPGEISDFFGWLTSHHLGHGVKAQLSQSCNAFIEYLLEAFFHVNRGPCESYLGQQQRAAIGENYKRKTSAPHCFAKRAPSRRAVRPSTEPSYASRIRLYIFTPHVLNPLSGVQFLEQDLGLLQVERVKAFGEPAIDRGEEIASRITLALIAPQPRHAHRRPQFPGLCLLRTRE